VVSSFNGALRESLNDLSGQSEEDIRGTTIWKSGSSAQGIGFKTQSECSPASTPARRIDSEQGTHHNTNHTGSPTTKGSVQPVITGILAGGWKTEWTFSNISFEEGKAPRDR
jgi:hypothetical protein